MLGGASVAAILAAVWKAVSSQTTAIWITSIATAALVVATFFLRKATLALGKAANVQFNSEGPFLAPLLHSPAMTLTGNALAVFNATDFGDYFTGWQAEDNANPNLLPSIRGAASYVSIFVWNRATKAYGVATDVRVTATLSFGSASGMPPHPYWVRRIVQFTTIDANMYGAGRLFNVGTLTAYKVVIEDVSYKDISGRARGAASGTGEMDYTAGATPAIKVRAKTFPPRKGELTDAIDQ